MAADDPRAGASSVRERIERELQELLSATGTRSFERVYNEVVESLAALLAAPPAPVPTEQPESVFGGHHVDPAARLILNEYGRACWDAGHAAAKREAVEPTAHEGETRGDGGNS